MSGFHAPAAPAVWRYSGFPLDAGSAGLVTLERACEIAHRLIDEGQAAGDEALYGPVFHWAHILKSERGPDGAWPAVVNAHTGEPVGSERTCSPALLLARLGALLDSAEFDL